MILLPVQLRSILVGLIEPLHNTSIELDSLTDNSTYKLAYYMYHELKNGPEYKFSPEFSQAFISSSSFTKEEDKRTDPKVLKRIIDGTHYQLLNDSSSKVSDAQPVCDDWSQAFQEACPDLFGFLYYLIAAKNICEEIEVNREEAQALSEIFSTLAKNYPPVFLILTINSGSPVTIHNAPSMFKKLSYSFRELADKKMTDPYAKLSLKNIIVY